MSNNFLYKLLGGFVDSFKQKNPMVFAVIAIFGMIVYFSLNTILGYQVDGEMLVGTGAQDLLTKIRDGLVILLTLIGAHTPKPSTKPLAERKAQEDLKKRLNY